MMPRPKHFRGIAASWQYFLATVETTAIGREATAEEWPYSALFAHFSHCQGDGNGDGVPQVKLLIFSDYRLAAPLSKDTPLGEMGVSLLEAVADPRSKKAWPTQTHGSRTPTSPHTGNPAKRFSIPGCAASMIDRTGTAARSTSNSPNRRKGPARQVFATPVLRRRQHNGFVDHAHA